MGIDEKARTKKRKREAEARLAGIRLYTLTEIEPVLGVSHRTLLRYVTTGRLPAVKIGGRWKVAEADLQKFILPEGKDRVKTE